VGCYVFSFSIVFLGLTGSLRREKKEVSNGFGGWMGHGVVYFVVSIASDAAKSGFSGTDGGVNV
jgi:hypothetical protein